MEGLQFSFDEIKDILVRSKWLILSPIILSMFISLCLCFTLPKVYRAYTQILVIPQQIPQNYVKSTVTYNMEERITTIRQEIFSRTRLEKIINELNLFKELRAKEPLESVIEMMKNDIELEVKGTNSFSVYYYGQDPVTVMNVANKLAGFFIEENLKLRAKQARGTTQFLETELAKVEKILKDQEKNIANFKAQHLGALPAEQQTNLKMIEELNKEQENFDTALRDAKNRKILLQDKLSGISRSTNIMQQSIPRNQRDPLYDELMNTQHKLSELEAIYTDEHPEVKRLRLKIQYLNGINKTDSAEKDIKSKTSQINPLYNDVSLQVKNIDMEIQKIEEEKNKTKLKIAEYKKRIELAPQLELELANLTRDYENNRGRYSSLLAKKTDAEQAENLERAKKAEQFEILDAAQVPSEPYKPKKSSLLTFGLMIGLAIGGGLAFLKEFIHNSFYTASEIENYFGLPVLVSIPRWGMPNSPKAKGYFQKLKWILSS